MIVKIQYPLKQGLKLWFWSLFFCTLVVKIQYPLKQGLKLIQECYFNSILQFVKIQYPLKQGLKLDYQPAAVEIGHGQNSISTKTRIETRIENHHQGIQIRGQNSISTKTRIETILYRFRL